MTGHKTTSENIITLESVWMNMVRGIAVSAVVIHHCLLFIPHQSSIPIFYTLAEFLKATCGTAVHLFFILSGCGLTISYFRRGVFSWEEWARRRFRKIIMPYWLIITLTFILVNLLHYVSPEHIRSGYSWLSLLAYLTFMRNFYSPGWELNKTLWFMPVIIGLYIVFPFLIKVLKKYGVFFLLSVSALITYFSIILCRLAGYPVSQQTALFFFYVIEFSLGIVIGYILCLHAHEFRRFVTFRMFCFGVALYSISSVMISVWAWGPFYNDLLTALGVYLVTLYACQWMIRVLPQRPIKLLNQLSEQSYLMYLIHGPLIVFLMKPLLGHLMKDHMNSLIMIILSGIYCVVVFMLARLLSPLLYTVVSRLCSAGKG